MYWSRYKIKGCEGEYHNNEVEEAYPRAYILHTTMNQDSFQLVVPNILTIVVKIWFATKFN